MMTPIEVKRVRDLITTSFADGDFAHGLQLLEKEKDLPLPVRLECQGNLHFYRRELQEAILDYEAAIRMAPDFRIARYQYIIGTQNEKQKNFIGAFERYQDAIEIEPTFVDSYIELGGLLAKADDFEGAAKCYRDASLVVPDDLAILHNLKAVLVKLAKVDPRAHAKELALVDNRYNQLVESGKVLPSGHFW